MAGAVNVLCNLIPFVEEIAALSFCHAPLPQNHPRFPAPFESEMSGPFPALIAESDFAISTEPTSLIVNPGFAFSILVIALCQAAKVSPVCGCQTVTVRAAACAPAAEPTKLPAKIAVVAREAIKPFFIIHRSCLMLLVSPHLAHAVVLGNLPN